MFIVNGMVYGSDLQTPIRVQSVRVLDDRILILTFTTGEQRLFDAETLRGPVYQPLSDLKVFNNVAVDHGVVTWMNGDIDCSPEYMYAHSYEYSQLS